ncbi:MAG: hypothetical protein MUF01_07755 [Bryobacterales bacterium]|nr:hypothetical protein [Bryobacterales bacterium]
MRAIQRPCLFWPCLLLTAMGTMSAIAATIGNATVINDSSPNDSILAPGLRYREFATLSELHPVEESGLLATFGHRMAWFHGHRVEEAGASFPQLYARSVSYAVEFLVEDPDSYGYSLAFDTSIQGRIVAAHEGNNSLFDPFVFAAGTLMASELIVDGGAPVVLSTLATPIQVVTANDATPFAEAAINQTRTYAAGDFFGTHLFRLVFRTNFGNNQVGLANFNWGEGTLRFGLTSQDAAFQHGGATTVGGSADPLGHSLKVRMVSLAQEDPGPLAVPEPETMASALLGLLLCARGWWPRRILAVGRHRP